MRIIIANYRYFIAGGPEKYMFKFMDAAEKMGIEVIPFSVNNPQNEKTPYSQYFAKPRSNQLMYADTKKSLGNLVGMVRATVWNYDAEKRLRRLIRDTKPDAVYILHEVNHLSPSIIRAAKKEGVRVVHRISDFFMFCPKYDFLLVKGEAGGIESLCRDYANYSNNKNVFAFLKGIDSVNAVKMKKSGHTVIELNYSSKKAIGVWKNLNKQIKLYSIEVIVVHHASPILYLFAWGLKLKNAYLKIVAYAHCEAEDMLSGSGKLSIKDKIIVNSFVNSDKVIAISSAVRSMVVFSACTAGIGNSIVVETKEKNYKDLSKFTFIICWGTGFCSVCLLCLYQPFMELWVGKDLMLSFSAVICFVVYFFVRQMNSLFNMYKDASGMWHEDRFRPLVAALTNLALNLILVQFIGIYGILISTVAAIICVGMPWLLHNLFTVIFERKHLWDYLKKLLYYFIIILISCIVTYAICAKINFGLLTTLIVRGIVCVVIPNVIYLIAYKKKMEFKDSLALVNKMTKGKLKGLFYKLGMTEGYHNRKSVILHYVMF